MENLRHFRPLVEWAALTIFLGLFFFHDVGRVPFHGDESQWIATSLYLEALFDPYALWPKWVTESTLDEDLQAHFPAWVAAGLGYVLPPHGIWHPAYWTLTQPPVARYVIAIGRLLKGYTLADLNAPWDFHVSAGVNAALGNMPSAGLLRSARQVMTFLSVVSGVLLCWLAQRSAGAAAAWCFAFLYGLSGYLLTHLRRAMGDPPLLFFTCIAMLTGFLALRSCEAWRNGWQSATRTQRLRPLLWLALMGIAAGLAGASKLNGLGVSLAGAVLGWMIAFKKQGPPRLRGRLVFGLVASLLVIGACATTFVGVNPYLYPNPLARSAAMFVLRTWEMERQQRNSLWGMPTLDQRLQTVPRRVLEDYTLFRFGILNGLLGAAGLIYLLRSAWRWLADSDASPAGLVLLSTACFTVSPALATPLDWDRYYLFPVIFLSLLIAIGIGKGMDLFVQRLRLEL